MTTPKSVFLPVFILMFGIGFAQKIIFAVVLAYFIVVPTGLAAAKSVPPRAHHGGAGRRRHAPPNLYAHLCAGGRAARSSAALRLALIFSIHGIIFAEMYASSEGIGRRILDWGEAFQMQPLLATVLLVLIDNRGLNELMQLIEARAPRAAAPRSERRERAALARS